MPRVRAPTLAYQLSWEGVPDESVREIIRQGELQLDMLLTSSIAADQRAMTLAAIFGTIAAALFAAVATLMSLSDQPIDAIFSLGTLSIGMIGASLVCAYSGRPRLYRPSGYQPKLLVASATDTIWMLRYVAQDIQMRIEDNRKILATVGSLTTWGYRLAIASLIVSAFLFVVLKVCH